MRIVFVVWGIQNGGAERAIGLYANALAEMGEDVYIVSLRDRPDDYPIDEQVKRHTLHVRRFFGTEHRTLNRLCSALSIVGPMQSILRTKQKCVVVPICIEGIYATWIILAAVCARARIVYPVRNNLQMKNKGKRGYLPRALFSHGIWVQLEGQKGFFPRFMRRKAFAVHNILNDRFLDIQREKRDRIARFINVGRLVRQKNQEMLIRAFANMVEKTGNGDATLTIYGRTQDASVHLEAELKDLIRQLGMEERIFLPGRVTDIEAKYEEADAFVFSSDYEGCPNALMEAMAAGLPCISTDCPTGPSEIIEDGKTGLLVPVGDVEAMSQAMRRVMENPQWANQMGALAKERMRSWGGAREQAQRLLDNFERI